MNEDNRVKTDYIKLLKTKEKADNHEVEIVKNTAKDQTKDPENREPTPHELKQNCNQCGFETNVKHYLKSHKIIAHTGQFPCQRGCKIRFKRLNDLEEHA